MLLLSHLHSLCFLLLLLFPAAAACCSEVVALAREVLGGNGVVADFHVAKQFCDMEAIYTYEVICDGDEKEWAVREGWGGGSTREGEIGGGSKGRNRGAATAGQCYEATLI